VLRLLANSFKHDPFDKPNGVLLKRLGLPENANYAPLSESGAVRFGLSKFLGIGDEATFSEIVNALRKFCNQILFVLRSGTRLRSFKHELVSLNPDTFERCTKQMRRKGTPVYFNKSKNLRPRDDWPKAGAAATGRSIQTHPAAAFLVLLPRAARARVVPPDLGGVAP